MGQVSLGVLRGYSDSASNEYGNFNIYLYYDSITRANNGNSTTVTFTNCYVKAAPVFSNKRYTSNTIYIDSVSIGSTSLGISSSWVGRKYAGVSNGKKVYLPQGHSTSKVTKNLTVPIGTGSLTVTLKGHRSGTETNSQTLTKTISFNEGWAQLAVPYANVVKNGEAKKYGDNGDNSATIVLTNSSWGAFSNATNNDFKSCGLKYSTDGQNYTSLSSTDNKPKWKVYIPATTTKILFKDIYISGSAQSSKAGVAPNSTDVKYYAKPNKPTITKIQESTSGTQMTVTVTATKGSNGSNNNATGVEIAHSVDGSAKSYKLGNTYTFTINSVDYDKTVIYARTVGTHNIDVYKNKDLKEKTNIYYSDEIISYLNKSITITAPGQPSKLIIHDSGQNQFSITCSMGTDGENNEAQDVEIYYTINGTSPLDGGELRNSEDVHLYHQGEFVGVSEDTTVNAVARTVGIHPSYKYSTWTSIASAEILYYQAPMIQRPTISYDKKLTKKSTITINQYMTIYKNSQIVSFKAGLYKDQNHDNLQNEEIAEIRVAPVIKFPYISNMGGYMCQYTVGTILENEKAKFTVLKDGCILAQYKSQDNDSPAKFYLNDYNGVSIKDGINLIAGQTYQIFDCILYYKDGDKDMYIQHGDVLEWKDHYRFIAVYIQQGIPNNSWGEYTYNPKISYVYGNNILDEIPIHLESLNKTLKTQSINLGSSHSFYLSQFDIRKGDAIYTKIIHEIKNKNGASIDILDTNQVPASEICFIESNGVMRVNVDGSWYEGQVWVNCDGIWKEATDIFVNYNTEWKESI